MLKSFFEVLAPLKTLKIDLTCYATKPFIYINVICIDVCSKTSLYNTICRWKKGKKNASPVFCEKAEADQNENHIVDRSNSSEQNLLYCTPDEITTCRTQTGTSSPICSQ